MIIRGLSFTNKFFHNDYDRTTYAIYGMDPIKYESLPNDFFIIFGYYVSWQLINLQAIVLWIQINFKYSS